MEKKAAADTPMPILDGRLAAAAGMLRSRSRVADIGCDHALLLCRLGVEGRLASGLACDKKRGPLERARENVFRYGLEDIIQFRLGDGLGVIGEHEADDIVITGMGAETIMSILANCPWKISSGKRLVLSPATRGEKLRHWLFSNGFNIWEEKGCLSNGRYYTVMRAGFTGEFKNLDPLDLSCFVGALRHEICPHDKAVLIKAYTALQKKARGLEHSNDPQASKHIHAADRISKLLEG